MTNIRTAAKAERKGDRPVWLKVIHKANAIEPDFFGTPVIEPWDSVGTVEEYEHARVLHRGDDTVSIISKTDHGSAILRRSAKDLGLRRHDLIGTYC